MNKQTAEFKKYLKNLNKYTKNTMNSYVEDVNIFCNYLFENSVLIDQVDTTIIRNFVIYELENNVSKRTVKRRLTALKKFYAYMKSVGYVQDNPFLIVSSPKADIKLPKYLEDDQIKDILNKNKLRSDELADRDQAILELLYFSGIRAAELVSLKIQDFDFARAEVRVVGKWNKQRKVPFTKDCQISLKKYLKGLRVKLFAKSKEKCPNVFLNSRGSRLTVRGLEYILKQIQEKTGVELNLYPHLLRHSFATNLLSRGAPLVTVKEILGHESAGTTAIYSHVTEETILRNSALLPRNKKAK